MKKRSLTTLFSVLFSTTLLLLLYVHIQTEIFRASYAIEKKEHQIAELSESYKILRFHVTQLRSPHYLNEQMKEKSMELVSPKTAEIIKIPMSKEMVVPVAPHSTLKPQVLSWLGFLKEAQAKPSSSR